MIGWSAKHHDEISQVHTLYFFVNTFKCLLKICVNLRDLRDLRGSFISRRFRR